MAGNWLLRKEVDEDKIQQGMGTGDGSQKNKTHNAGTIPVDMQKHRLPPSGTGREKTEKMTLGIVGTA